MFVVGFLTTSIMTAAVLLVALDAGIRTVTFGIIANIFITMFFTQYGLLVEEDESNTVDLSKLGGSGRLAVFAAVAVYLNVLVGVSIRIGMIVPAELSFAAAGLYVLYDLVSVRFGIPLSVTGLVGLGFAGGALVARLVDSLDWRRLGPVNLVSSQLRDEPPRLS